MNRLRLTRWFSTGLVLGSIGCNDGSDAMDPSHDPKGDPPTQQPTTPAQQTPPAAKPPVSAAKPGEPEIPASTVLASLSAAADCDDLLTRVQDDAIAKLMMQVELYKKNPPSGGGSTGGAKDAGVAIRLPSLPSADSTAPSKGEANSADYAGSGVSQSGGDPVAASETNSQVEGVDEADFVKVVDKGQSIYLLQGDTLRKLDSWPAAQTKLVGEPLKLEGMPSEMFVTDRGKAVVFSSVYSYQSGGSYPSCPPDAICDGYYGGGYYGGSALKITVADVSGDTPKVEREIYYEGSYVSSRRYGDVVRAVIQSYSKYAGLFTPQIEWTDAWGRAYDKAEIDSQLDEWEARTESSIRNTELSDWIPVAQQVVNGKLVDIAPGCDSYFVPDPGLADYGLTHVLSLDTAQTDSRIGGVTVVGAVSTVYSNDAQLVLAQPDYRWGPFNDFGVVNNQQTAYHVFALDATSTRYTASGWLFGTLPSQNAQFGIDVAADGTLRVATTGWIRDQPTADPNTDAFWKQHTENRVISAKIEQGKVVLAAQSEPLGHDGESIQSARFVGDRGYVVTYRQKDPLIVLDLSGAPKVLGEIEIPGFSQYVHPLDPTHLITVGQAATGGIQLQLFDVSDPANLPKPRTLDFGSSSSSEVSYNHKAFTAFQDLLAMPMYGQYLGKQGANYVSTLEVVRASVANGFSKLATIDHSRLYADNGAGVRCGVCDVPLGATDVACYDYACSYAPELRRGHFVQGEDGKTYVYSFSYAGVLVHVLSPLQQVAAVGLPAPTYDYGSWYGGGMDAVADGGIAVPTSTASAPAKP
jgi:hypothetical protein